LKRATRAVFWDIDGTLLVTGRAGVIAWHRALAEVAAGAEFPAVRPDGLTDHQIAEWLLKAVGAPPENVPRLVRSYERGLDDALPMRSGRVLDNVTTLLEWLGTSRPGVLSWLVSGNTFAGGTAKLAHYGLTSYFSGGVEGGPLAGSFSERVEPRADIVRRAVECVTTRLPGFEPSEALVIGDTPHDIEGAHAVGVPVLAVASNTHPLEELQSHHPWRAMSALPDVANFAEMLAASR
jgi:phosphoglycolate phosphatase